MIDWLTETVRAALADNAFFQGGFVLMAIGAAAAALRYLPSAIWGLVQRWFTVSVHIREGSLVGWVGEWLASTGYGKRCRRLNGFVLYNSEDEPVAVLEPGMGLHLFRHRHRWFWLDHELEDVGSAEMSFGKQKVMTLRTFGRNPDTLRDVIDHAVRTAIANRKGKQVAFINDDYGNWSRLKVGTPRPFDSVVLPEQLSSDIRQDAEWFFGARDWHLDRGLPYRRGYLLYGPPGNGKSSLVGAIAGFFDIPIYVLSLSSKGFGDRDLATAMSNVESRAVVVIEDVEKLDLNAKKKGVTPAGLLNAIDGALASDGRLLILTANDETKIDPILLRPGRIDRRWRIGIPGTSEITRLFDRFFPSANGQAEAFAAKIGGDVPMAAIQQHLARYHTDPELAVQEWTN